MEYRVKQIISKDFEEIVSSSLSLELLKVYSILYLCGKQPNSCVKSQRKYYEELKKTGLMKVKEDHKKTCTVNWKGNRYISKQCRHFNNDTITDAQAIDLLKKGHLSESDFIALPQDYKKAPEISRKDILAEADKLKIEYKKNIKTDKLVDLINAKKVENLQEERALEIIEYGVEEAPKGLGEMNEEDYKKYIETLKS